MGIKGGLYKSWDNHTKRKAPVEALYYRELVSYSRITIPPQGRVLGGQKDTPLWHANYDMHVLYACTLMTIANRRLKVFLLWRIFFGGEEWHVSLCSHSWSLSCCLPISPAHFSCLSISQHVRHSPVFLAENISMWSRTRLSEPDVCRCNSHSPLLCLLCSRLNMQWDSGRY